MPAVCSSQAPIFVLLNSRERKQEAGEEMNIAVKLIKSIIVLVKDFHWYQSLFWYKINKTLCLHSDPVLH